jgi:hypothetical protein
VWPIFVPDFDPPDTTDALSVLKSALASAEAAQAIGLQSPNPPKHQSPGQQEGAEDPGDGDPDRGLATEDPDESTEHAANDPSEPEQVAATWRRGDEAFTAIMSDGSAVIHGAGAVTTLAPDAVATFKDQTISMPPGGSAIEIDESFLSFDRSSKESVNNQAGGQATAVFTLSGQTFTAAISGNSLVPQAAGAITTIARGAEATFAGQTVVLPSAGSNAVKANGALITMQALSGIGNKARISASAVWTQSGGTFTAKMEDESVLLLQGPSATIRIKAGSFTTIGNAIYSVPSSGNVIVHDGTSITLVHALATSSATVATVSAESGGLISALDAGSSVIVIAGDNTFALAPGSQTTLGGRLISAVSTGGVVVIGKTNTVSVGARTSIIPSSNSASEGSTTESLSASTGALSAAAMKSSPVLINVILIFAICGALFCL